MLILDLYVMAVRRLLEYGITKRKSGKIFMIRNWTDG